MTTATSENARINWVDILERLLWTFVEGFLGSLPVIATIADLQTEHLFANAAIVGGGGAVISFVKNLARERLEARRGRV
jgi:hypothetical protein